MLTFTIDHKDHCRCLESFLRSIMPMAAAAYCRKLIKSGAVRLNGDAATSDSFLYVNDNVTLKESGATLKMLACERPPLDILYEDDQLVVVNKPPGLPMHQTAEQEANLVDDGMDFMARRNTPCKLYPVNRLDRGTSGAVIMAKSSTNAGIYGRQVKETGLDKLYLALVKGSPDRDGVINAALDGKESETRYRLLLSGNGCALLAVTPVSGRIHQIRRHLEIAGYPVIGDKRYGGGGLDSYAGICLHSFRTLFVRPEAGILTVCAPLSAGLLQLWELLGVAPDEVIRSVRQLAPPG
ncbi:MAG: RluA family pseudouridine synthase [Deltaproteobacteria bacterium]